MTIEIRITNPSTISKDEMRALATYLLASAGIANDDLPDVGAPHAHEVFTQATAVVPSSAVADQSETAPEEPTIISAEAAFGSGPKSTSPTTPADPTPPAAPPAPPAPPAVPPTGNPAVLVDTNGLPWDARIHSSSREQVKGGVWKAKRNVAPELVATVTAELRQLMAAPTPPAAPPPPAPTAAVPLPPGAVPPPPAGVAPPPPPAGITPVALFGKISAAITAGQITPAAVQELLNGFGIPALPGIIAARPELAPSVDAGFEVMLAAARGQ